MISVFAIVASKGKKRFFQSRAANLQSGKRGIASQQKANHRLTFTGMDLDGFAVFFHIGHPWNLEQSRQVERGNATNPLSTGLRLDLCRCSAE
jgi:hypothetical protein